MKFYFCLLLFTVAICFTSCSPVLYTTVGQNVPLFKQKGEVAINVGAANTQNSNNDILYDYSSASGIGSQLAIAIDSSVALISSLYSLKNNNGDEWNGKGSYFEVGVGKFKYNPKSKLIGEIFIGTGFGSLKNSGANSATTVNANYIKPFIQPSAGFSSKVVDLAITTRFGLVTYTSHSINSANTSDQSVLDNYFDEKKTTFVFEPGFTFRLGFKNVKMQYQFNYTTFKYSVPYQDDEFDPVNSYFQSVGVYILFSNRWLKNNSK